LFGSRAIGTFRGASDVDLALEGEGIGLSDLISLKAKFGNLQIPLEVDLIVRSKIENPDVEKHIQDYGREWYRRGWKKTKLKDACLKIGSGATPRGGKEAYKGGATSLIRSQNIYNNGFHRDGLAYINDTQADELSNVEVRPNDVLLNITGDSVARCCQVALDVLPSRVNQHVTIIRPKAEELDARFLRYVLVSDAMQNHLLSLASAGATRNALTKGMIEVLEISAPPLPEQKAIAAVLGALDDKIELNRRMNATLEAMARALFQSWFVDFDPVRAKLDGRPPPNLAPATAALFPEHFAHGEHDMLPVGWRLAAIKEVCDINAWTLGKNDDLETLEYVEISEVSRGNIANIASYPRGEEPSRARRRLRHGDTVLSTVRPDRGSYFLALNPPENRVASTGFAVLTPTKVPWSFLHAALTLPEVSDHLGQMADGGAYPAVRPEIIGAIKVAVPNEPKILECFDRICAPLFKQAESNRTQSRTLATLRDTLLPKLLSGELILKGTDA
jgi:type I restriction enzyme S subunit